MLFYLFLLLIVLPVTEILILVRIGELTQWWVPIAIVIVTGVVGTALARREGWKVLTRIREDVRTGQMPADSLLDGFLVLVAGILFVLPGVLSDFAGIILLFPPTRTLVKRGFVAWFKRNVRLRVTHIHADFGGETDQSASFTHDQIIDAKVIGARVEDIRKPR